ncbi:MAG TPA: hypothetical protein VEF76_05990, partial [Patescibacteria group bacterium]|nr:hypothetical protein [Patescibacteria group bacterium]
LNADRARDQLRENVYGGMAGNRVGRGGLIVISGWTVFFGLLGFALGAISSSDRHISAWEGALGGLGAGLLFGLAISVAIGLVFRTLGLGWAAIRLALSGIFGGIGGGAGGLLGGLPRAAAKGAAAGGAIGGGIALLLGDQPVLESIIHLAPIGGAAGIGWRLFTLTRQALRKG